MCVGVARTNPFVHFPAMLLNHQLSSVLKLRLPQTLTWCQLLMRSCWKYLESQPGAHAVAVSTRQLTYARHVQDWRCHVAIYVIAKNSYGGNLPAKVEGETEQVDKLTHTPHDYLRQAQGLRACTSSRHMLAYTAVCVIQVNVSFMCASVTCL
jgi:hypothetical protein